MGRARIEPRPRNGRGDAAAVLESARPRPQSPLRCLLVARSEGNHMSAAQVVLAIAGGEPFRRMIGLEIRPDSVAGVGQGTAHNLDDSPATEINAGSEHGERLPSVGGG